MFVTKILLIIDSCIMLLVILIRLIFLHEFIESSLFVMPWICNVSPLIFIRYIFYK